MKERKEDDGVKRRGWGAQTVTAAAWVDMVENGMKDDEIRYMDAVLDGSWTELRYSYLLYMETLQEDRHVG